MQSKEKTVKYEYFWYKKYSFISYIRHFISLEEKKILFDWLLIEFYM